MEDGRLSLLLEGCGKHKTVKVAVCRDRIVGMCTAQTRISTARGDITAVVEAGKKSWWWAVTPRPIQPGSCSTALPRERFSTPCGPGHLPG